MSTKIKLSQLEFAATELAKQNAKNLAEDGKLSKSVRDKLTKARRNLSDKIHAISSDDKEILKGAWDVIKGGKSSAKVAELLDKWSKKQESGLDKFGDKNPFA